MILDAKKRAGRTNNFPRISQPRQKRDVIGMLLVCDLRNALWERDDYHTKT